MIQGPSSLFKEACHAGELSEEDFRMVYIFTDPISGPRIQDLKMGGKNSSSLASCHAATDKGKKD